MSAPYALDIAAAADYLTTSTDRIRDAIKSGSLPAVKLGPRWSIKRADLEAWHDSHTNPDRDEDAA